MTPSARGAGVLLSVLCAVTACGGGGSSDGDGTGGAGGAAGAAGSGGAAGNSGSGGSSGADLVERGAYVVKVLAICGDCHTPTNAGVPDEALTLSGVECFIDVDPTNDQAGCIHTANLTDHETGLANRSDQEIEDMFREGTRPNGQALHPIMPYWVLCNKTDEDADAVVAYLRTVPGVDHQVPPNQAPFADVAEPSPRVDYSRMPMPDPADASYESAMRGRYLTAGIGVCFECHTPDDPATPEQREVDRAFQGGRPFFPPDGVTSPPYPPVVISRNLTPHATGIEGWTADDIVTALKQGRDKEGNGICLPMPAGPMGAYADLTADDAADIAAYILSLPPGDNDTGMDCAVP